jgi:hypothetical protein
MSAKNARGDDVEEGSTFRLPYSLDDITFNHAKAVVDMGGGERKHVPTEECLNVFAPNDVLGRNIGGGGATV